MGIQKALIISPNPSLGKRGDRTFPPFLKGETGGLNTGMTIKTIQGEIQRSLFVYSLRNGMVGKKLKALSKGMPKRQDKWYLSL
ncbi:MAG: hypothetical protein HZC16_01375 [Candidatus Omnitrophica bacterium]|nr:hypothetical protein [Candidatus Omnitrophota bacterium]